MFDKKKNCSLQQSALMDTSTLQGHHMEVPPPR